MITDNRLGTLEDVMNGVDPALAAIVFRLREILIDVDPDTTEQPRPGDRALSYGVGPRKMMDGYAYLIPMKGYVNLGFYKGTSLPDPDGLLEGTGKDLRHVKIRSLEAAGRPEVRRLIAAAVTNRKTARTD
ncbi:MAG TPA: DUF1801 domain-containing protein [Promineifilum sp.]